MLVSFIGLAYPPDLAHCTVLSIPCYIRLDDNRIFLHYSRLDTRGCFLITAIFTVKLKDDCSFTSLSIFVEVLCSSLDV